MHLIKKKKHFSENLNFLTTHNNIINLPMYNNGYTFTHIYGIF